MKPFAEHNFLLPRQESQEGTVTHYRFLDGLRGLMAIYVAAYHFLAWTPENLPRWMTVLQKPLSFGHVAVAVFIVLSGFSLMLPVTRAAGQEITRGFPRIYLPQRPANFTSILRGVDLIRDHHTCL